MTKKEADELLTNDMSPESIDEPSDDEMQDDLADDAIVCGSICVKLGEFLC